MAGGAGQPYAKMGEVMSRHDSSTRPLARRVDTDPSVWQDERSVRPVQDAQGGGTVFPYSSAPNQSTPTKWRVQDEGQHVSPYASQHNLSFGDPALQRQQQQQQKQQVPPQQQQQRDPGDLTPRQEWRNSSWGRGNGSVGVTGGG